MLCAARCRLSFFSGAYQAALALADEAVSLADALPPGPLRLDARLARSLVLDNMLPGRSDPRELLAAARELDDPAALALAHNDAACMLLRENADDAVAEAEAAVAGAAGLGPEHGLLRAFAFATRGEVKLAAGDVEGALADLETALAEPVLASEPYLSAMVAHLLSQTLSTTGRTAEALDTARRALERLGPSLPHARILLLRQEAACLRADGRGAEAYDALAAATELDRKTALELSLRHHQLQAAALETAAARRRALELEERHAERVRLLARTVEAAEQERRRVALELHDGPIQRLTAAALNADRLQLRLGRGDLDGVVTIVAELREQLAGDIAALRRLMAELRPPVIDERGLAPALADCAAEVLDGTATSFSLTCELGGARLASELETVVYRIVREALVNTARHSGAAHAAVDVACADGSVRVVVADDGCGFDPENLEQRAWPRLGLVAMRERAESVEGSFAVRSAPGEGTEIELVLPYKPPLGG